MADQLVTNESPATATQWFAIWRLFEVLLLSGWTVHYSSDGTTHSASDNWTSAGFSGLGSGSYIILNGPGGRQVLFQRATTSTINGTVRYDYTGSWGTSGAGATTPPTAPSTAATVRNNTNWFGSTSSPVRLNIWSRDISTGDGSFCVVFSTSTPWTSGGGASLGLFALESTEPEDSDPYAWWAPENAAGSWSSWGSNLGSLILAVDNAGGTTGTWRRWHFGGTPAFVQYGSGGDAYQGAAGATALTQGQGPSWSATGDSSPFGSSEAILHRVHLVKRNQTGRVDANGGWVKDLYFATPGDVPNLSTLGGGDFAKLGSWLVMRWNGNPATPPVES